MRKKKKSGQLPRGPFTFKDLEAAIRLDGWKREPHQTGGGHITYNNPDRDGKITLDVNWDSVKVGHRPWHGVCEQGGYSKKDLQILLDGRPLR